MSRGHCSKRSRKNSILWTHKDSKVFKLCQMFIMQVGLGSKKLQFCAQAIVNRIGSLKNSILYEQGKLVTKF